jgi:CheY-like chemotaxis protein
MATAHPFPPRIIAVVEDHPAEVYCITRGLHAHGVPYVLQVLERRQRALQFFDRLATPQEVRCPDLLLLDCTVPGLNARALLPWIKAVLACRR